MIRRTARQTATIALTAAVVLATAPQPAQAFRPHFPLPVVQVPDSRQFEVVQAHNAGPREVWCAAAEHTRDVLRLPTSTRLYIAKGRAPSPLAGGRTAIRFSPDPVAPVAPPQDSPLTVSLRDVGQSLSVGHALSYCQDQIEELFHRF